MTRDPTACSSWQLLVSLQQHQLLLPAGKSLPSANRARTRPWQGGDGTKAPSTPRTVVLREVTGPCAAAQGSAAA